MWLTDRHQQLWRNYLAVSTSLHAVMNRQLQQSCGLTLADYDVLVALSEAGRCRITELATALGWEQSRLSHQLRRMRERDLVQRHESADDGRGAEVTLTENGREQLQRAAPGHVETVRRLVFDGIADADLQAASRWLAQVRGRLA